MLGAAAPTSTGRRRSNLRSEVYVAPGARCLWIAITSQGDDALWPTSLAALALHRPAQPTNRQRPAAPLQLRSYEEVVYDRRHIAGLALAARPVDRSRQHRAAWPRLVRRAEQPRSHRLCRPHRFRPRRRARGCILHLPGLREADSRHGHAAAAPCASASTSWPPAATRLSNVSLGANPAWRTHCDTPGISTNARGMRISHRLRSTKA